MTGNEAYKLCKVLEKVSERHFLLGIRYTEGNELRHLHLGAETRCRMDMELLDHFFGPTWDGDDQ